MCDQLLLFIIQNPEHIVQDKEVLRVFFQTRRPQTVQTVPPASGGI